MDVFRNVPTQNLLPQWPGWLKKGVPWAPWAPGPWAHTKGMNSEIWMFWEVSQYRSFCPNDQGADNTFVEAWTLNVLWVCEKYALLERLRCMLHDMSVNTLLDLPQNVPSIHVSERILHVCTDIQHVLWLERQKTTLQIWPMSVVYNESSTF